MATSLVGGAAVGAVFGELLKAVLDMKDRAVMFKPTLAYLSSILQEIAPVIKEIEQHNKDLGRPKEELERLIKEMEEGTKLVCECSKIHKLNYFKRARYQDQLEALVDSLVRFFNIDMLAQTARDTKETLLKVRSIDRKLMKLSCAIRMEETTVLSSDSGSVPVYVSELEIHHSRATQPAENAAGTNSGEQVVVRQISQETTSLSWDSDSVSIDVSESESLHSTATQPAEIENEAETNFIEQLMEPITNLTQEVGQVLERDQIMNKFHEVTARLEQTLGGISYDKLNISDDVKKQGSSSDSSSVLVDMSELEIHHSKATQLAEIAMGTNSAEQVVLRHISQKTSSSWDSDPVSVDVSESKTLHATTPQFAEIENASETNSIEQVLEPITSLTQEFGQVLKRDLIMNRFHEVTARLEQALGEISYDKLDKSNEVKKKVELFLAQFRIARERVDAPNVELYEGLLSLFNNINDVATDPTILRRLAENLQLIGIVDLIEESLALHEMVAASGGDPGAGTEKILMLLKKIKYYVQTENIGVDDNVEGKGLSSSCCRQGTNEKNHQPPVIPDDFRCPISQELMKDPVIVSTGETYERSCIEKWLEAGNVTCPKTQKALSSAVLTPNFALRSLIAQWCQANGIEPPKQPSSSQPVEQSEIENLLAKLTFGNLEDQRSAVGEIRLLTKCNADNRVTLAEAGAIPPLVDLLSSLDSRIQEHAVTALLNLSICENNKGSIVSSGAVPGIVHVLKKGSMEARENAAATIFNLSFIDENKGTIGSSGAIPPLVKLLREGTQRGKKDAATALFNLCICEGNKRRAVRADIVPILMLLLTDPGGGVVDEALGILVLLASHHQGRAAIRAAKAMPALVEVIRNGSPRNRENAAAGLVHICWGDQQYLAQALELGVMVPLLELAQDGTDRGKRKAVQLLKMIDVGANYF